MLSAMTLDQLGAKMHCDKCGKRPERYREPERHARVCSKPLDGLVPPLRGSDTRSPNMIHRKKSTGESKLKRDE
jgi:hypothetical protein